MSYADWLRDAISSPATTPDRVILQFSTAAPIWKKRTPKFIKRRGEESIIAMPFNLNWASPCIRWLCHSPFSHVDFVLPDGNLLGASDQGEDSPCIEGNPRGVAVRPANYQKFGIRRNMVIKTDKAPFILSAAVDQLGKPFDNGALKNFIGKPFSPPSSDTQRNWRALDSWFCAELPPDCFDRGGYWWPRRLVWPMDCFTPTSLIMLFQMDPNFINAETFWDVIPGLVKCEDER